MFLRKSYFSINFAFCGFKVSVTNDIFCDILHFLIPFYQIILLLDQYYFQTSNIITKPIGIIWQKRCPASIAFYEFWEKLLHFHFNYSYCFQVTT